MIFSKKNKKAKKVKVTKVNILKFKKSMGHKFVVKLILFFIVSLLIFLITTIPAKFVITQVFPQVNQMVKPYNLTKISGSVWNAKFELQNYVLPNLEVNLKTNIIAVITQGLDFNFKANLENSKDYIAADINLGWDLEQIKVSNINADVQFKNMLIFIRGMVVNPFLKTTLANIKENEILGLVRISKSTVNLTPKNKASFLSNIGLNILIKNLSIANNSAPIVKTVLVGESLTRLNLKSIAYDVETETKRQWTISVDGLVNLTKAFKYDLKGKVKGENYPQILNLFGINPAVNKGEFSLKN